MRLQIDLAAMRRGQAEESAYYLAQERKRQEQEPDGGKLRKNNRAKTVPEQVLAGIAGEVGQAIDRAGEKRWIELGGRPLAVEAKDTAKREADFANYIARRNAQMVSEGQGGGGGGGEGGGNGDPPAAGAPAEGQP